MNILNPDRNFKIEQEGEVYYGKFPLPSQEIDIDLAVARRMGGVPLESFPNSTYGYLVAIKTLDYVIVEKPNSFLKRYKSFEDVEDSEFVVELYTKYIEKKNEFIESGKKNRNLNRAEFKSGTDSRPISDAELQYPDEQRFQNDPRSVPISEDVHRRSNIHPGEFRDLPFKSETIQQTERDYGNRSENIHSQGNSNFPGGSGRVQRKGN